MCTWYYFWCVGSRLFFVFSCLIWGSEGIKSSGLSLWNSYLSQVSHWVSGSSRSGSRVIGCGNIAAMASKEEDVQMMWPGEQLTCPVPRPPCPDPHAQPMPSGWCARPIWAPATSTTAWNATWSNLVKNVLTCDQFSCHLSFVHCTQNFFNPQTILKPSSKEEYEDISVWYLSWEILLMHDNAWPRSSMYPSTAHVWHVRIPKGYVFRRTVDGIHIIHLGKTWEKIQVAARPWDMFIE